MSTIGKEAGKLRPCPMCGGEAKLASYVSCDCCGKAYNGQVICQNDKCKCEVTHFDTDEEAIAAWNRRDAHDELVAALESIHRKLCEAQTMPGYEAVSAYGWCIDECRLALSRAKGEA